MTLETLAKDIAASAEADVKAIIDEAKAEAKRILDEGKVEPLALQQMQTQEQSAKLRRYLERS